MVTYVTQSDTDAAGVQGDVFRAEFGATIAVASTGTFFLGVLTGNIPLRVLGRAYTSSESPLSIELFEATFSAGANVRTLCRNLSNPATPPAQFVGAVTPGTLGSVITGITLRAPTVGGTAAVSLTPDNNVLVLKRNTSYVVRLTNGGGANAVVAGAIDYQNIE